MPSNLLTTNVTWSSAINANSISSLTTAHSVLAVVLGSIIATYVFFGALLRLTQDAKEPALVSTSIPFLSPILGMARWNMGFYLHMRDKYPSLPIYTLRLPGVRLYIVNSTNLIPVIQRQWRTLLFPPVTVRASEAAMGGSKEAIDIMCQDMVTEKGFLPGLIKVVHPSLAAGPTLHELNGKAVEAITRSFDKLVSSGVTKVKMFDWVRRELLLATTNGVYGTYNPLRDPQNREAWHKFHPTIMFLMLDLLPHWVFRSGIQGREHLANSFAQYQSEGKFNTGSTFIQRWQKHFTSRGIPERDIGRFHVGGMFALVANTIPTAFWAIYRILSDPSVLEDCREEVSHAVEENNGVCTINSKYIKNSCPTLISTFQEVLRFHGMGNSVRVAAEDHILDGKYLIKKGGMIMIPSRVQHRIRDVWGPDVDVFKHRRFIRKPGVERPNPVAFRGFGGGTTLCPGRHFATNEILLFAAMLLLRFDVYPVGGRWITPTVENSSQAEAMEQPDNDLDIELHPRPGADKIWRVSFGSNEEAALVAEDIQQ
ncbi:cytochrome P450 [Whalleya microplaca]|nr:cytochrome P450 [Whalleya microplaca]